MEDVPICWNCGYDRRGLPIGNPCPECGTPAPIQVSEAVLRDIKMAQRLGVGSLAAWLLCLGPLAVFVAVPAIVAGRRAMAAFRSGRADALAIRGVKVGVVCAWIAIGLSALFAVAVIVASIVRK